MRKRFNKREEGQAMVEFALILPILILLICGILDFGWIFGNQLSLNNAGRESARYMAINYDEGMTLEQNQAVADAILRARLPRLDNENLSVSITTSGETVSVTASYPLQILTPVMSTVLGEETITIDTTTSMRLE